MELYYYPSPMQSMLFLLILVVTLFGEAEVAATIKFGWIFVVIISLMGGRMQICFILNRTEY